MGSLAVAFSLFVLALLLGHEIITRVPPTLHTPLMSGSNAISGITLVGALIAAGADESALASGLGVVAVALATTNVVGGFAVTHRMLAKFRSHRESPRAKPAEALEKLEAPRPSPSSK